MKKCVVLILACLAAFYACKGDSSSDMTEQKFLDETSPPRQPENYQYIIKGIVACSQCKPDDFLYVNIEDEDGNYLLSRMWNGKFGDGNYQMSDITLVEGKKVLFRAFVDVVYPVGKASDLCDVPLGGGVINAPTITIP